MRIIGACILSLLATAAAAENLSVDRPNITYQYTTEKLGSLHFCDLATWIIKSPVAIKLTAAFVSDDKKPKNHDITVAYMVELFGVAVSKDEPPKLMPAKVVAGRIISDVFNSDLHATKNVDRDTGASYAIPSEGSIALFMNIMMRGEYSLYVEAASGDTLTVAVKPTPDLLNANEKWTKCSIALAEHRAAP